MFSFVICPPSADSDVLEIRSGKEKGEERKQEKGISHNFEEPNNSSCYPAQIRMYFL
jgi:hypothetical protein